MASEGRYHLSPLAETDLEDIWRYTVERWSSQQAETYHADIIRALDGLASGVKTGRRADIREGYFKYAVGSHVIYYRQQDTIIAVIRILHQRMDVNRHL
ncbi:MAG: type II toxin-antitoxin system RelE/ParE family toxin [Rhizobiaceae bacterium]|nr:type II toxin-antitoxin system RelE/ParE family toxin [Rhizobiaceae bacterium]